MASFQVCVSVPGTAFLRASVNVSNFQSALENWGGNWNYRDRIPVEEVIDIEDLFEDRIDSKKGTKRDIERYQLPDFNRKSDL